MTRNRLLLLLPLGAAAAGVLVAALGIGATVLVANAIGSSPAMTDVAVAVLGIVGSVAVGVLVWLSLLVVAARRLFQPGGRLAPVLLSAVGVLAVAVAGSIVAGATADDAGVVSAVVLAFALVGVVGIPAAVFVLRGHTTHRPGPPPGWPLPPR